MSSSLPTLFKSLHSLNCISQSVACQLSTAGAVSIQSASFALPLNFKMMTHASRFRCTMRSDDGVFSDGWTIWLGIHLTPIFAQQSTADRIPSAFLRLSECRSIGSNFIRNACVCIPNFRIYVSSSHVPLILWAHLLLLTDRWLFLEYQFDWVFFPS